MSTHVAYLVKYKRTKVTQNCAKITMKHVKFWNRLIYLKCSLLTWTQPHLLTVGRVHRGQGQHSHTNNPQQCLVSGSGNTRVHITRSNNPDLSLVAYTICGISQKHVYKLRVQNVDKLKQCKLDVLLSITNYYWQCSNDKRGISQGSVGTQLRLGKGKSEHLYSASHGTNHSKALRHGSHSF